MSYVNYKLKDGTMSIHISPDITETLMIQEIKYKNDKNTLPYNKYRTGVISYDDFKDYFRGWVGIYMIKNIINNKVYIGKSKHIVKRFQQYKSALKNNYCHNPKLQKDYNQFGVDSFIFKILDNDDEDLDVMESEYIKKYNALEEGYNLHPVLDYTILKNVDFVTDTQMRLIKGLIPRLDSEKFLLTDIADTLKISVNDLKVIIKNIKYPVFEKYDIELIIENEYTTEYLRKVCISARQEEIRKIMIGFKL